MNKVIKLRVRAPFIFLIVVALGSASANPASALNQVGTSSGAAYGINESRIAYDCPSGYVVTSLTLDMNDGHGANGGLNKSPKILNATCTEIKDNLNLGTGTQNLNFGFGSAPTPAGTSSCSGGKALNSIRVWGWLDDGVSEYFLSDLGADCLTPSNNSAPEQNTNAFTNSTGFLGGPFMSPNLLGTSSCATGSLVTGINLSHGLYLHSISVRCSQFRSGLTDAQIAAAKAASDAAAAAASAAQKQREEMQLLALATLALGTVSNEISTLSSGLMKRKVCTKGKKTLKVLANQSCPKGFKAKK